MDAPFFKLLKLSAKRSFQLLRERGPLYCQSLDSKVKITRVFWDHIVFSKKRNFLETNQRILMVPIIEDILKDGTLKEERFKDKQKYYALELSIESIVFGTILVENKNDLLLLSCFIKKYKKRDLSDA